MKNKFIIKPFNRIFWALILIYSLFLVLFIRLHQGLPEQTLEKVVICFYLVALVAYFLYKYAISKDDEYNRMCGFEKFNWFNELPLQICNLVLIETPLGTALHNEPLLGIAFFSSLILAPVAIAMPSKGFEKHSLFIPRVFGFYFTHLLVASSGIMLYFFDIYRPQLSQLPVLFIAMFAICYAIYCINILFRKTGLNPLSNYFFNIDPENNAVLKYLKKKIPYQFWYTMPVFAVFDLVCILLTFIINLF